MTNQREEDREGGRDLRSLFGCLTCSSAPNAVAKLQDRHRVEHTLCQIHRMRPLPIVWRRAVPQEGAMKALGTVLPSTVGRVASWSTCAPVPGRHGAWDPQATPPGHSHRGNALLGAAWQIGHSGAEKRGGGVVEEERRQPSHRHRRPPPGPRLGGNCKQTEPPSLVCLRWPDALRGPHTTARSPAPGFTWAWEQGGGCIRRGG